MSKPDEVWLMFNVDLAESFRRGFSYTCDRMKVKLTPRQLSPEDRALIADNLDPVYHSKGRSGDLLRVREDILAAEPTLKGLLETLRDAPAIDLQD